MLLYIKNNGKRYTEKTWYSNKKLAMHYRSNAPGLIKNPTAYVDYRSVKVLKYKLQTKKANYVVSSKKIFSKSSLL